MMSRLSDFPRVLHVVPSLHIGGVNASLINLVPAIIEQGGHHEICVITSALNGSLSKEFDALDVKVTSLNYRGPADLVRTIRRLRSLTVERRIDLIHSHLFLAKVLCGAATVATDVRHVSTIHSERPGRTLDVDQGRLRASIMKMALNCVDRRFIDRHIAVSSAVRRTFLARHPNLIDRVVAVPNGVHVDQFRIEREPARTEIRHELGLSNDTRLLLNVGRLVSAKRQHDLAPIAARLAEAGIDFKIVLVGEGDREGFIRAEFNRLGVTDRVEFLGSRRDVPRLLAAADVVVVTSETEGFSVALLEAMASGRPVVATDIMANRDAIGPETGWLVGVGDIGSFVEALSEVLNDLPIAAVRGSAARLDVATRFDQNAVAQLLLSTYRDVLEVKAS